MEGFKFDFSLNEEEGAAKKKGCIPQEEAPSAKEKFGGGFLSGAEKKFSFDFSKEGAARDDAEKKDGRSWTFDLFQEGAERDDGVSAQKKFSFDFSKEGTQPARDGGASVGFDAPQEGAGKSWTFGLFQEGAERDDGVSAQKKFSFDFSKEGTQPARDDGASAGFDSPQEGAGKSWTFGLFQEGAEPERDDGVSAEKKFRFDFSRDELVSAEKNSPQEGKSWTFNLSQEKNVDHGVVSIPGEEIMKEQAPRGFVPFSVLQKGREKMSINGFFAQQEDEEREAVFEDAAAEGNVALLRSMLAAEGNLIDPAEYFGSRSLEKGTFVEDLEKNYSLFQACELGEVERVRALLQDPQVDPEFEILGLGALAASIAHKHTEVSLLLISDGRVPLKNSLESAALLLQVGLVQTLLKDVRIKAESVSEALLVASPVPGNVECVRLLLQDSRVDPNWKNQVVVNAAWSGDFEILSLLLSDPRVDTSVADCGAFRAACRKGDVEAVKLLLPRSDPSAREFEGFRACCSYGRREVMDLLLEDGRVNYEAKLEGCVLAAASGNIEMVKTLIVDHGVNPADENSAAIRQAARYGELEVVKFLLEDQRVDPSDLNNDAIWLASAGGFADVVRCLLADPRVHPHCKTKRSDYPVFVAASKGHLDVVEILLQDERVDGAVAIERANLEVLPLLMEDPRCGMLVNPHLFRKRSDSSWVFSAFETFFSQRLAKIHSALWCMREIGEGWGDLQEPMALRMSLSEKIESGTIRSYKAEIEGNTSSKWVRASW